MVQIGMSGGPCYVINQNQIIGIHIAGGKGDKPNYGTVFTDKVQELIDCAKEHLPRRKVQLPRKRAKRSNNM